MRVALVYNYESRAVINRLGRQNKETYDQVTISAIEKALTARGHRVSSFEADKHIIDRLELFMPTVITGEQPGLVFNLSYGIKVGRDIRICRLFWRCSGFLIWDRLRIPRRWLSIKR